MVKFAATVGRKWAETTAVRAMVRCVSKAVGEAAVTANTAMARVAAAAARVGTTAEAMAATVAAMGCGRATAAGRSSTERLFRALESRSNPGAALLNLS